MTPPSSQNRRRGGAAVWVLAGLAAAAVAGAALWFQFNRAEVSVAPVRRGMAQQSVPATVVVTPKVTMDLRVEPGGRVERSQLERGRTVVAGDPLLDLDPRDLDLQIARDETELAAARERERIGSPIVGELAIARDTLAGFERRTKEGNYPPSELENRRREVVQIEQRLALAESELRTTVLSLENELERKRRERAKMTLTAPMNGTVTEVLAHRGDLISPGQAVARLLSSEQQVEARVSEENFAAIRPGQRASVRLLGYGEELFAGEVARLLPTADPATQRYTVLLDVAIVPERLVPGLTGEAAIVVGERAGALVAPRRAVVAGRALVVRDGRLEERTVRTGFTGLTDVEVLDGLAEGDLVVTDGLEGRRAGERVRVAGAGEP